MTSMKSHSQEDLVLFKPDEILILTLVDSAGGWITGNIALRLFFYILLSAPRAVVAVSEKIIWVTVSAACRASGNL